MTLGERTKTVTDEVGTATTGAELRALIAKAITAAVEEEGQECAQILEIEAKRYECGDFISRKIEALLLTLATKMRARCNKSATESNNTQFKIG